MYDTVLVPTDGSDLSMTAAEEALDLTTPDGTIHALGVIDTVSLEDGSEPDETGTRASNPSPRAKLEEATDSVGELAAAAGIDDVQTIRKGVPFEEITSYAAEIDADAIVMGKRGQGAIENDELGSTSQRVLTHASAPVVVIPVMLNLRRYREESRSTAREDPDDSE